MKIEGTYCVLIEAEASAFCKIPANETRGPERSPLAVLHGILADVIEDTGRPSLRMISSRG